MLEALLMPMVAIAASSSHAQVVYYGETSQHVAVQLDDEDCGFCFYESGRVAVCVNKVNEYQRCVQLYEDNATKTLLATMDEHAIGSAGRPHGPKLLLTKDGGLLLNSADQITKQWRWDPKAQHAGTPPSEPIVIKLNDVLLFTYTDRHTITVKFAPRPGISIVFACGQRLRRHDTYWDHARRVTIGAQRGKLVIDQDVPTLQQRQKQIELDAIEKRSKAKPRSQDLGHDAIKAIVSTLETAFDAYEGCKVTPAADGYWKEAARRQSLCEIPMLPPTGAEVGDVPTLLGARVEPHDASPTLKRLQHPTTGMWLGSVELNAQIRREHPTLPRKGALSVASGRYMRELPVTGYINGKKPSTTARLVRVPIAQLDAYVRELDTQDVLVVVACLRTDDPQSCTIEMVLEQIQYRLHEYANEPPASPTAAVAAKCRLIKCDLAESSVLADRFRIHAAPTFLLYYKARLVEVSSLGGASQRVFPATTNAHLSHQLDTLPRVLVVENVVKHQVVIEKALRKEAFSWDLALGGEQAIAFLTRMPLRPNLNADGVSRSISIAMPSAPTTSTLYGVIVVSDTLEDTELRSIDRLVRSKDKARASASALVCAIVTSPLIDVPFANGMCVDCRRAQGRRIRVEAPTLPIPQACPHCGIIAAGTTTALVSPVLSEVAQVFVYKHIKPATLHRLAELWATRSRPVTSPIASSFKGLTVDSFFQEMKRYYAAAKRGLFIPEDTIPAMALSVGDAVLPVTIASLRTNSHLDPTPTNVVRNQTRASSA